MGRAATLTGISIRGAGELARCQAYCTGRVLATEAEWEKGGARHGRRTIPSDALTEAASFLRPQLEFLWKDSTADDGQFHRWVEAMKVARALWGL
jgi:hypothetical protein